MNLVRDITGEGPTGEVLILGGILSANDVATGRIFGSPSGVMLRKYCAAVGLDKVRFENVVEHNCRESELYYDKNKTLPTQKLDDWYKDVRERIKLIKPKLIIPLGNVALKAITDYTEVSAVHCYIIRDIIDLPCPVLPCYHPSTVFAQRANAYWIKFALDKARHVLDGKTEKPYKTIHNNNFKEAVDFLEKGLQNSTEVCIDIETIKNKNIFTAIGFSFDGDKALSVSRIGEDKLGEEQWAKIIDLTKQLMESKTIMKIGQNFAFDAAMLWKVYSIGLEGPVWDTMHANNTIYCDLKKSLEELIRLYLYRTPHKTGGWNSTGEKLRIYNAADIITTHRVMKHQEERMKDQNILEYFQSTPMKLFVPAFHMATRGINMDIKLKEAMQGELEMALLPYEKAAKDWAQQYTPLKKLKKKMRKPQGDILVDAIIDNPKLSRKDLDEHLNTKLHIPKKECKEYYIAKAKDEKFGLTPGKLYEKAYEKVITLQYQEFNAKSPSQVKAVLENADVKLPSVKQQHTKKWAISTNDNALKKILQRDTDEADALDFIRNMLALRQGNKLMSSYCNAKLDPDNRWRCHYNIEGTETGRSSSKKTNWGTGGNNQNIPRDGWGGFKFKKCFLPDEGMTLFQSDQEQAEARVVAYLADCPTLIKLLNDGEDIHVYAINSILGADIRTYDKEKYKLYRNYGKIINHGGNYDMGPVTLAESALKRGIKMSVKDATYFLAKRRKVFPEIYENWHAGIQAQLHKDRTLWTPFGRRRVFFGKLDNKSYREAYAHIPQSTVPHITNLMWLHVESLGLDYVDVVQQGHDALLMQIKDDKIDEFIPKFLAQTESINFELNGYTVNIPWDANIGKNWGDLRSYDG